MASDILERKLFNAASKGNVTTLVELLEQDPYLIHEAKFSCSRNLLHIAAMHGQTAIVEELLKFSPRLVRISDSHNSSPLHIAVEEGHVEISQKLLLVAPEACWWRDSYDMNPVHIAAMKGHVVIMEYLLQVSYLPAKERLLRRETVLHLCVKHGQLMGLKVLVDKLGNDFVNAIDEDEETLLHFAVRCNQFERDYMVVERVLLRLSLPSMRKFKPYTNSTMVVAVLIATMAFQNTVNPAGGVWQDDKSPHKAGEAVITCTHPHMYKIMLASITVSYGASMNTYFVENGKDKQAKSGRF
ncbi:ankyrin repeat-containing protein ITN1-like [Salvia hispanica]|uniref:ankyrin repeat-containing protein ITN1-like n=1 Tax=Salvia hispanica TaxID=49212 RepID=UPI002009A744|nr:ankyrin repeat-containing protein ITN1-like [Salvia hispanica]